MPQCRPSNRFGKRHERKSSQSGRLTAKNRSHPRRAYSLFLRYTGADDFIEGTLTAMDNATNMDW
jgi:hypothetical protein